MWPVSSGFLAELDTGATLYTRAELLNPDLTPLRTLEPVAATVRVQEGMIRRTASMSLVNDGTLTPDPTSDVYFWNPLRLFLGVAVGSAIEWIPTFTGYMDDAEDSTEGPAGVLTLPCRDRMRLASDSTLGEPLTRGADVRVGDVIRQLLEDAGMGTDDALFRFDDAGRTLGQIWTWETDRNRLEIAASLAQDFALELFADPLGVAVLRPWIDPTTAPTVALIRRGVQMLGFRKRWRDRLKNRIIVIGDGGNGEPVRVELRDMNPLSPGYNPPAGHPDFGPWPKIGDRPETYRSSGIIDSAVALDVASRLLSRRALVEEEIDAEVPVNPAFDLHDVIDVYDGRTQTSGRWTLDAFDVGHGPSVQRLPARRVRALA